MVMANPSNRTGQTDLAMSSTAPDPTTDSTVTSGEGRARRLGPLPLLGRDQELDLILAAVRESAVAGGTSLLITGRAGLGKSRLLDEAATRAAAQGTTVLRATAERGPSLRPHDVLLQVLTAASIEQDRRRRPRPTDLVAAIRRLEHGGDDLGRSSTLTAFTRAVLALGSEPVLITVDDAHWADPASEQILIDLAGYVERLPVVLVRSRRPDAPTSAPERRATRVVELEALNPGHLQSLLENGVGLSPQAAREAGELLIRLGGDTPAVLEHLIDAARGLSDASSDPDFLAHLAGLAAADPRDVMSLRLASLAPWTREVLAVAAVVGSEFDLADLASIIDQGTDEALLLGAVVEGEQRRVIEADGPQRFRFTHPLGPELLYERLAPGRRAALHHRAATLLAERGHRHLVGAARHLLASGRLDDSAVPVIIGAAEQSLARSAFDEAAGFFDAAMRLGLDVDDELHALVGLGRALAGAGRRAEARDRFEDVITAVLDGPEISASRRHLAIEAALAHAEGGDFRVGAQTSADLIDRVLARRGLDDADTARLLAAQVRVSARVDRVVTYVDVDDVFPVDATTSADRVQWSYAVRTSLAHDLAREALAAAERSGDDVALLDALCAWRSVHRSPHDLAERTRSSERALHLANRLGRRSEGVELRGWLAVDHLERGDRRAFDLVAGEVDAAMGRFGTHRLHWLAACLRTLTAQLDSPPRDVAQAATAAASLDIDVEVPGRWTAFAILLWRAGELDDDRTFARRLSKQYPDIFDQAAAAAMLGISRWRDGDETSAHELLDRSLERLRQREHEISWLLSIHAVADLAAEIGDRRAANELVEFLRPWQDRITIGNHGTVMLGPIARPLGRLLDLVGASDSEIDATFDRARRLADQVRGRAFQAETALDEAMWHRHRGRLAEAAERSREALRLATAIEATRVRRRATDLLADLPGECEPNPQLTPRQRDILEAIAEGLSNPQIARRLAFSLSTVAKETSAIYRILGVATRRQAAAEYQRRC